MAGDVELFKILRDNGQNCELNSSCYENKNMLILAAQASDYNTNSSFFVVVIGFVIL